MAGKAATLEAHRAALAAMGLCLGPHLGGASEGAWAGQDADGTPVVLKWVQGQVALYLRLGRSLEALRAGGAPVPGYLEVLPFGEGVLLVQRRLPGRSEDVLPDGVIDAVVEIIGAARGLAGPDPDGGDWGAFVVDMLRAGGATHFAHGPLAAWSAETAALLERIRAVGVAAEPGWFPMRGLVHLDLHTDNILVDAGRLGGVIDWEGACHGDPDYDLVQLAFDLDGHGKAIWGRVEAAGITAPVLRAYLALLVLKCTSAAIAHRPMDVPRQMARAARVFARYGV